MNNKNISRKDFLRNSVLGVAGLSLAPALLSAKNGAASDFHKTLQAQNYSTMSTYSIKNVRLETGFEYQDGQVIGTKTQLFTLDIENGLIKNYRKNDPSLDAVDADGLLALPGFKDMHMHLDKTFYGQKWQAVRPRKGGVKQMIALEQQIMPSMLENSKEKAQKLIDLLQKNGSSFTRSHVNIEPTSKLKSLENLQEVIEQNKSTFSCELVAFPQHGLFYTDSLPYMKQAAKMDIDFIGALDPTTIDGSIERTIDATVSLALDNNKGIDMHLHETGQSGVETIEYLIKKVQENPSLEGKTYLSHCFALAKMPEAKLKEIAYLLSVHKIGVISTVPFGNIIMPIPLLQSYGVNVSVGNDSIIDHWNTMGSGSVLQKANVAAELYGKVDEYGLSRSLSLATNGITPLDNQGDIQWPKQGDPATITFVDASCSAEAVARISPVGSVIHKGKIVY